MKIRKARYSLIERRSTLPYHIRLRLDKLWFGRSYPGDVESARFVDDSLAKIIKEEVK